MTALTRPKFEGLLVLAFIVGAVWAGYRVLEFERASPSDFGTRVVASEEVRSEWNEVRLFDAVPSFENWEKVQRVLAQRVVQEGDHTLHLGFVFSQFPPLLIELNRFDDFDVRAGLPMAGSVVKLTGVQGDCMDFVWSRVPLSGVNYTVEFARSRNFDYTRSFGTQEPHTRFRVERKGDLFWRVKAWKDGKSMTSAASSFFVQAPELSAEEQKKREASARVNSEGAWLADLKFCN